MLNPNQLSDEALAVLRVIAQTGSRKSGNAVSVASIEQSWKESHGDLEVGLADLEIARLVKRQAADPLHAVVTDDGEAFFGRYFHSCY